MWGTIETHALNRQRTVQSMRSSMVHLWRDHRLKSVRRFNQTFTTCGTTCFDWYFPEKYQNIFEQSKSGKSKFVRCPLFLEAASQLQSFILLVRTYFLRTRTSQFSAAIRRHRKFRNLTIVWLLGRGQKNGPPKPNDPVCVINHFCPACIFSVIDRYDVSRTK